MEFKGLSFPFRISTTTGGVEVARFNDTGETTLIKQSLHQIINTAIGERVIEKDFGTSMSNIFDPNDPDLINLVKADMIRAILIYEPRVTLLDIQVNIDEDQGKTLITVVFKVNRIEQEDAFSFTL